MKSNSNLTRYAICILLISAFLSCKQQGENDNEQNEGKDSADVKPLYLTQLKLTATQFDSLKSYKGNLLVFQFFYPGSKSCESPTLYAYAMQKGKKQYGKKPEQLAYDSVTTEPFTGRAQVLGDQQLKVSDLVALQKDLSTKYAGKDYHFNFTPKFYADNPHVYYEVQARGGGKGSGTIVTNPSPPAHGYQE